MVLKSLLSRARRFLEPRALEMYSHYDDDGECYMVELQEPLPRVILVTDRAERQWDPEVPSLKELGYEMYDRELAMRASYYARRPWLWLLRSWTWASRVFWRAMSYTHGKLWHDTPGSESRMLRWRDVRPGPVPLGWFRRFKPRRRR
jgi:hypothetical protein